MNYIEMKRVYCQGDPFDIERCPHCRIDKPQMEERANFESFDSTGSHHRHWACYACARCGGVLLTGGIEGHSMGPGAKPVMIQEMYPEPGDVSPELPKRAKEYLRQAKNSVSSPSASVVVSASAVDPC